MVLQEEGLAYWTRGSAWGRRATYRMRRKPLGRLLLSRVALPTLYRLLFLSRREDREPIPGRGGGYKHMSIVKEKALPRKGTYWHTQRYPTDYIIRKP